MTISEKIRFDEQVVVITGAGNGLGRAYALLLASLGASVVVNDYGSNLDGSGNSAKPADEVTAQIIASGGKAVANYDSVATSDGGQSIIRSAIDNFGRLDILICNAGIYSLQKFEELTNEVWARMINVHLDGTFFTTRAALPIMKAQNYGRIIFTSSSGGMYGKGGLAAYGAAKGGISGLMLCLCQELENTNLKLNTILPGAATRMVSSKTSSLWENNPQMSDPFLVAPLVAYLASKKCVDNGCLYSAGGGFFARDVMMQTQGKHFDYTKPILPEDIADHWAEINDLSTPKPFADVMEYGARMFNL